MTEVIRPDRAPGPPGLLGTTPAPGLPEAAWLRAHGGPDHAAAEAAMDRLRATAARVLREHLGDDGKCTRCRLPWPCDSACLAESALGAG
jgi:hypothetical protein